MRTKEHWRTTDLMLTQPFSALLSFYCLPVCIFTVILPIYESTARFKIFPVYRHLLKHLL